jgi:hypothetical protein
MHMRPTAAAVASLNWPFKHDASFECLTKCLKANIHAAFSHVYPVNLPTRVPEDPLNDWSEPPDCYRFARVVPGTRRPA